MARMLDYNSYPWTWSECSRHFITTFLDAGYGQCLLDKSRKDLLKSFEHVGTPPGELYDMDYQCELVFGQGSRICPYMPVCKRLWCTMEDISQGGCRTQHMPWADGTRCGLDKSCLHGECVQEPAYFSPPQHGQWGEWQSYGPCSRSCGGGIARSIRECDSPRPQNGGRYCVGDRIRYKSCQTQDCPIGSKDFRGEQCSAFNGKTFGFQGINESVIWVPHYSLTNIKDRCKLYCLANATAAYFLLKEKVIDGTTCGADTFDICINGKCMPAGCDHVLYSEARPDSCGVCGGNDTTCRIIRGEFTKIKYGYNDVVTIPAGASNIEILQYGHKNTKDDNYLALLGSNHEYLLNGKYMISMFPKSVLYGDSILDYTGSDIVVERINATKRLQKDLFVQVLTVGNLHPPSVTYQYTISTHDQVHYRWRLEDTWSPCNSVCQGEQYRKAICVNKVTDEKVHDGFCHEQERPQHEAKVCNPTCLLRWHVNQSNIQCSSECGRGFLIHDVTCIQQMNSGETHTIPDHFCAHMEPIVSNSEECMGPCITKGWKYGEWSQCSVSCGGGIRHRKALCFGDETVVLPESACDDSNKVTEEVCSTDECPHWKEDKWSECSATCGYGEHQRLFVCQHMGKVVSRSLCNESLIASVTEPCNLPPCLEWKTGEWQPCSVTCGVGTTKRNVHCTRNGREVSPEECSFIPEPNHSTHCELARCGIKTDPYSKEYPNSVPPLLPTPHDDFLTTVHSGLPTWKTSNWSSCSVSCGQGNMYRQVFCQNSVNDHMLPDKRCNRHRRPAHVRTCQLPACGHWNVAKWSECSATCGHGIQSRLVECLSSDGRKSAEELCDLNSRPKMTRICKVVDCEIQLPMQPDIYNSVDSAFYWRTGLWGKCSKSCGGGIRRRQVACYDDEGQLSTICDPARKPQDVSSCNLEKCPEWNISAWSECLCGKFIQTRTVQCINNKGNEISKERCESPTPETERRCKNPLCPQWTWSPWSQCTSTCSRGTQTRFARCRRSRKIVPDSECDLLPNPGQQIKICRSRSCSYHWRKRKWSKCSAVCGRGYKFREVSCVSGNNMTVADSFCSHKRKPRIKRKCHQYHCTMTWMTGHWSECSKTCGKGVQTRNVTCHRVNAYKWINPEPVPFKSNEQWCNMDDKPSTMRRCSYGNCTLNVWKPGPWLPCSAECGTGRQKRRLRCYNSNGKRLPNSKCEQNLTPQRRRRCHQRSCSALSCSDFQKRANITKDGEQEIFVRGRYVKIFCARMNTSHPQEYITLITGEQDNYSEVYNKRLKSPDSCPYRGARYDSCDCITDDSVGPGLTTYRKIAINITSLAVLTRDLTFSQTHVGQPVPFGESGDCYSMALCPQGRFSLSLLGTGFIVSPLTKWITYGSFPSSRIRWLEGGQVIQGKCGGYCGRCAPDSHSGLLLEVAPP
ncbi:A disintegrin and metalloproteinase with thrombospondin motifs 9-like isoform X2 [Stegodyphus dumicola]|nr:A disintegrin and metalloproteinase with thrombospondin motifs 9-like isoform X2 [Stegodyphus dumicola]